MPSTEQNPLVLVKRVWIDHSYFSQNMVDLKFDDIQRIKETLKLAAHRLQWLELVVKGLNYQQQHDAASYAKFVDKKHHIEDLDVEELRALLRER